MAQTDGISKYQDFLKKSYADLIQARPQMIEAATFFFDSAGRRNVFVDSLITGTMDHLHEFARNESAHANDIRSGSPNGEFPLYADSFVTNLILGFQNLQRLLKTPPAAPPGPKKPAVVPPKTPQK